MTHKTRSIRLWLISGLLLMVVGAFQVQPVAAAAIPILFADTPAAGNDAARPNNETQKPSLDPKTQVDTCPDKSKMCTPFTSTDDSGAKPCDGANCFYGPYINPLINALAALVGVAVLISMIYGGIQYSSAGGDASKVSAAKQRIMRSLYTLFAFFFLWAFLNWLIPGGIL